MPGWSTIRCHGLCWQHGLHTCQGVVWVLQLHTLNLGSQVNFDVDALGARRGVEETRRDFWSDVWLLTPKAEVVQDLLWILLIQVQKFWHTAGKPTTIKDTHLNLHSNRPSMFAKATHYSHCIQKIFKKLYYVTFHRLHFKCRKSILNNIYINILIFKR